MRPTLLLSTALLFLASIGYSQSPPGINYQGVARDLNGKPLVLKDITIKINIVKDNADGAIEYAETHSLKTNSFGLFTLVIGTGNTVTGDFRFISWAMGDKWLRVEMDPDGGSSFQLMGAQQFMSVPYAFYAKYSGNSLTPGQGISITNNVITNTGDSDNSASNELNSSVTLTSDRKLRITDAGGTKEADLSSLAANQTLNGVLTLGNDAGGQAIKGLGTPVATKDATTKEYVDSKIDEKINQLNFTGFATTNYVDTQIATVDPSNTNEIQTLTFDGSTLQIDKGNSVDLSGLASKTYVDTKIAGVDGSNTNEIQTLTFDGSTLQIDKGNSVDLSGLASKTYVDTKIAGVDGSNTNEIQDLTLTATKLKITNNPSATEIDLTPVDKQRLMFDGTKNLSIDRGNVIDISGVNTDRQTLSLTGSTLAISGDTGGNSVNLAGINVPQTLSFDGTNLSLSGGGGSANLGPLADDKQTLSLSGTDLTISGSNSTVSLLPFMDDTDDQDLTLSGHDLMLTNDGTAVNLQPYMQNVSVTGTAGTNTRMISISGGTGNTFDVTDGDANSTNELQSLTYNGATKRLSISSSNFVDMPETQNLSSVLSLGNDAGGTRVTNLGAPTANTDAVTKQYVDAADNALSSRISANYAFKTNFAYSNLLALGNDIPMPLSTEAFDDFNVVNTTNFTAAVAGTYVFMVDGSITGVGGSISVLYNGTKYPLAIGSNNRYNSSFMFRLTAGQTVSLVADGLGIGTNIAGSFFGYKLL
ncbi:MAG TPA: hypothetical protein VFE50_15030 [Cyclobacteriaceae bacterium]|nr:hypothetical protein [Cyclobacteriaceae bacterium]